MEQSSSTRTERRSHRTRSQIASILSDWEQSGLSIAAYGRLHGYGTKAMYRWRSSAKKQTVDQSSQNKATAVAGFIPLVTAHANESETKVNGLRWELPGGLGVISGSGVEMLPLLNACVSAMGVQI